MRAALLLLLLAAGCGYRGPLTRPAADGALPPRAERARQAAETEAALAVAPQAQPVRLDEPLRRGTVPPEDPFAPVPLGVALPPLGEAPAGSAGGRPPR